MVIQQIFSIPVEEGKYLIYAPLKRIAFVANSALVNAIVEQCNDANHSPSQNAPPSTSSRDKPDSIIGFLHHLNFFQPEPLPVDEYSNKGVQYDAVILFLTNQCNLICSYCYASSGEYSKKEMSWEIAKSAIDLVMGEVVKNKSPAMTLGFHGGGRTNPQLQYPYKGG